MVLPPGKALSCAPAFDSAPYTLTPSVVEVVSGRVLSDALSVGLGVGRMVGDGEVVTGFVGRGVIRKLNVGGGVGVRTAVVMGSEVVGVAVDRARSVELGTFVVTAEVVGVRVVGGEVVGGDVVGGT
jgi:hypothetical protein